MKSKIFCLALALALGLTASGALASEVWDDAVSVYQEGEVATTDAEREAGNPIFEIRLANGGVLRGELYPEIAPESVGNFIALANSGFYDGLIFHRVADLTKGIGVPGYIIQGGDPLGMGIGGPGWNIKGEFASNGVENNLTHSAGMLSMARAGHPDSAGSQFFVIVDDVAFLDGDYACFGRVTEGMDYARDITTTATDANDTPLENQAMASIRVETFGKDYPFTKIAE